MKQKAREYRHSAYWYAKNYGWTHSEAPTFAGQYIDCMRSFSSSRSSRHGHSRYDSVDSMEFNPLILGVYIAMDIGVAVGRDLKMISDKEERARLKEEFMRDLRIVRRPFYYARETRRRRELAAERRKIKRRTTTAPMPTPEGLMEAWNNRKDSKEDMIILGGMLEDLECYVDNRLYFDDRNGIVGRRGGIRGWLKEFCPELSPKYKTLMRYKAMAKKLRQATGTKDPTPTSKLLEEPLLEAVEKLLKDFRTTFSILEEEIDFMLNPETVLASKTAENREPIPKKQC